MPKNDREYRSMELRIAPPQEGEERSYKVEGYASTFDPYTQIDPHAFDEADLSDVVFRIDHEGRVYARTSADTLWLWSDDHGLGTRADLSKTAAGREVFESIEAGNYPKMSFAFVVDEDGDEYDKKTHTRLIHRVAKVFDVSPVSFPANPGTELSVSTRDYFNGVIEAERAERLEAEKRAAQIQRIIKLTEGM